MAEDTADVDPHLFFCEVLNKLHIAVAYSIHERVPVIGSGELVDKMWESVEEVDDLFSVSLLWMSKWVPIQQNILVT